MKNNNTSRIKTYKIYYTNTRDEILTVRAVSAIGAADILVSQLLGEKKPEDIVILPVNGATLIHLYYHSRDQDKNSAPNHIIEYKIVKV